MKKILFLTTTFAFATFAFVLVAGCHAQTSTSPDMQQTANEIRTETLRPNNDPAGHALPLLASWNVGKYHYTWPNRPRGIDPAYQLDLIGKGHHIMPTFAFPEINGDEKTIEKMRPYYEESLRRAAALKLPICIEGTQWEQQLTLDKQYFELPPERNPNVVTHEGAVLKQLSPFGPVELWREVGARWASSPLMKQLQQWYPDPPQIIFLSNNESGKLRWHEVEKDRRYLEKYGEGRDANFKRQVIGDAWIERFRAMQEAMREQLDPAWQPKLLFVGYDAFGGAAFGRWGGWINYSLYTPGRFEPDPLMWDGSTPSYYTHNWDATTDFNYWSVQIQSMNWVFMQREALKLNPQYRFNFSVWDGHEPKKENDKRAFYKKLGQEYTPARYAASTQFGLWLLRPRVVREFRGWTDSVETMEPWFLALAGIVDRVYRNETLKQFWRTGELVPNRAHQHLYQAGIPAEYKDEDRWFLLDTNLDPPRPWKLDTEIPVFSLALVKGEKGARRWLVYAHSPLQERQNVAITIPEYGKITVDVPVAGAFYVVDEKAKRITPVL